MPVNIVSPPMPMSTNKTSNSSSVRGIKRRPILEEEEDDFDSDVDDDEVRENRSLKCVLAYS